MNENSLPSWNAILINARDSLNTARNAASDASAWMRSDWSPLGSTLTDVAADARSEIYDIVGQIKDLVDRGKAVLERAKNGTVPVKRRAQP